MGSKEGVCEIPESLSTAVSAGVFTCMVRSGTD
jgi:hypothetical protein